MWNADRGFGFIKDDSGGPRTVNLGDDDPRLSRLGLRCASPEKRGALRLITAL
jgi:hypothetical protein